MNDKKNKLDYQNLNALIQTARVILKLGLILAICAIVIFGFILLEKTQILSIIGTILSLISPLFVGFILAWLFEPTIKFLEKKKVSRRWGTIITYLIFVILVIVSLVLVVPEFVSQLKDLIGQAPVLLNKIKDVIANLFSKFKDSDLDIKVIQDSLVLQFETFINNFASNSLGNIVNAITEILSEGVSFALGVIIAIYLSFDYDKFMNKLKRFIPIKYKEGLGKIVSELSLMCRGYVNGTLFSSLIVAFLTFLGLIISGVSSPLLFAIFCGITNIIPYFGPYIGGIPVIIVGFSISPICGIITAITIILVQFVEGNILNPIIVGRATDIHPITLVVGLLVFEYYFGIIGMILATPIIGAVKIIFNYFNNKYNFIEQIKTKKDRILEEKKEA